jgi:GNAT superfamily N-acetyltransferase
MTIIPYSTQFTHTLSDLMTTYMAELDCGIPEDIIRGKLTDLIDHQCREKIIFADIAMDGQTAAGFSVYQIDTEQSDWCKRPGWGFIREFYVVPECRKSGTGKALAAHTEQQLRSLGAKKMYLTSTDAVPFWEKCGWKLTEELCSNGQQILEK